MDGSVIILVKLSLKYQKFLEKICSLLKNLRTSEFFPITNRPKQSISQSVNEVRSLKFVPKRCVVDFFSESTISFANFFLPHSLPT